MDRLLAHDNPALDDLYRDVQVRQGLHLCMLALIVRDLLRLGAAAQPRPLLYQVLLQKMRTLLSVVRCAHISSILIVFHPSATCF